MYRQRSAANACGSSDIRHALIGFDKFRTTIRIPTIIKCIYPYKYIRNIEHFSPCQCIRKKNSIAGWHIGGRDLVRELIDMIMFGHRLICGERRASKSRQIDRNDPMLFYPTSRQGARTVEFNRMTLSIGKREREYLVPLFKRHRQHRSRI